jgi:hypothetical protein
MLEVNIIIEIQKNKSIVVSVPESLPTYQNYYRSKRPMCGSNYKYVSTASYTELAKKVEYCTVFAGVGLVVYMMVSLLQFLVLKIPIEH